MMVDTNSIVFVTEANQDFSRVAHDEEHRLNHSPSIDMSDDEKIDLAAARILEKYKPAFLELAK